MLVLIIVFVVMVVMMVVLVLVLIIVFVVMVVMMMVVVVLVLVLIIVVMVVMMVVLVLIFIVIIVVCAQDLFQKGLLQIGCALDGGEDHLSVELGDRCCDDGCILVVLAEKLNTFGDPLVTDLICSGQNDGARIGDLVVEELAEILEVNLALGGIHDCAGAVEMHLGVLGCVVDGTHDIGKFADTRGLDQDALRSIGVHDFLQGSAEIAYQRAADAARVHLADLNAGLLEESAVDADLTEFILDQDNLCAGESVFEKLLDQCRFAGTEKSGNNINFCHFDPSCPALTLYMIKPADVPAGLALFAERFMKIRKINNWRINLLSPI